MPSGQPSFCRPAGEFGTFGDDVVPRAGAAARRRHHDESVVDDTGDRGVVGEVRGVGVGRTTRFEGPGDMARPQFLRGLCGRVVSGDRHVGESPRSTSLRKAPWTMDASPTVDSATVGAPLDASREAGTTCVGSGDVPFRRLAPFLLAAALFVTACGDDTSTAETAEPPTTTTDGGATPTVPPLGSCDADAAFAAGVVGAPCDPLDPGADDSEVRVTQIPSTAREDLPSALEDPNDATFPAPLIDLSRVISGGPPPDGIPAIDDPVFQNAAAVDWLTPAEAVLALEVDGEARAYPIRILVWHELVNDTIGDTPVTISYCPLCNSALAYDRRLGDRILDFGTSGRLFNSSMVMYDRQTETLWTHFDGTAVAGALAGAELDTFPISTVSWEDFRTAHPDAMVLTRNTGFRRDYGRNPYEGYDDATTRPFLYDGEYDDRLEPKTRVVVVRDESGPAVAIELERLLEDGVVEFEAHGRALVAVLDPGTASPLHRDELAAGYDQGAVGVFVGERDGEPLSLTRVDEGFLDATSGLIFDVLGNVVEGNVVAGDDAGGAAALTPVEHLDTFWFAIAAFDADVEIL